MTTLDKGLVLVLVSLLVFVLVAATNSVNTDEQCVERGGVPHRGKCFSPEAFK